MYYKHRPISKLTGRGTDDLVKIIKVDTQNKNKRPLDIQDQPEATKAHGGTGWPKETIQTHCAPRAQLKICACVAQLSLERNNLKLCIFWIPPLHKGFPRSHNGGGRCETYKFEGAKPKAKAAAAPVKLVWYEYGWCELLWESLDAHIYLSLVLIHSNWGSFRGRGEWGTRGVIATLAGATSSSFFYI